MLAGNVLVKKVMSSRIADREDWKYTTLELHVQTAFELEVLVQYAKVDPKV